MEGGWLVDDGPDTLRLHDAPNKKCYARSWRDDRFERE
jgi:hypothetical protein